MEKILRWWTLFLIQLEAGKRVIAIFIIITMSLTYSLVNMSGKLEQARKEAMEQEKKNSQEISRIKDSASIIILRNATFYNDKTENIYKEQLDKLNKIQIGYQNIKRTNDKIVLKVNNK